METKINNNYVVQIFIANMTLLIIFCVVIWTNIYPSYSEVQGEKVQLSQQYATYKRIAQEWINFSEFITQANQDKWATDYLRDLIKVIPESFYNKNIKNTSWWTFLSFVQNKTIKVEASRKDKLLEQRDQKLQAILPSYSDGADAVDKQDSITEFEFVNYVESLLYAFNLTSTNAIGISDLIPVKEFTDSSNKPQDNLVDTNIYYIPLKLEVFGKKTDIVDFLHFIENVGSISVGKWEQVQLFSDQKLKNVLSWREGKSVYENQVFDIEVMRMNSYLDSKLSPSDLPLVDLVKKEQANEPIGVEFQLRFYIKWLPNYLVKKYIKDTVDKYDSLVKKVDKRMKEASLKQFETSDQIIMVNSIKALNYDLQSISDDMKKLKTSSTKNEEISPLYKKSIDYMLKFTSIESTLDKIDKKLQLSK